MICPQCNTQVHDDSKFCPVCGMAFNVKRCVKCGAPVGNGSNFCSKCGAEQNVQKNCTHCNAPLEASSKFCPNCGTSTEEPKNPMEEKYAVKTLVFGILGLAFAATFYLAFLGIIFSIISKRNSKKYLSVSTTGKDGRAKAGKGLSTAGLIVGIIFTVLLAAIITLLIIAGVDFSLLFREVLAEFFGNGSIQSIPGTPI